MTGIYRAFDFTHARAQTPRTRQHPKEARNQKKKVLNQGSCSAHAQNTGFHSAATTCWVSPIHNFSLFGGTDWRQSCWWFGFNGSFFLIILLFRSHCVTSLCWILFDHANFPGSTCSADEVIMVAFEAEDISVWLFIKGETGSSTGFDAVPTVSSDALFLFAVLPLFLGVCEAVSSVTIDASFVRMHQKTSFCGGWKSSTFPSIFYRLEKLSDRESGERGKSQTCDCKALSKKGGWWWWAPQALDPRSAVFSEGHSALVVTFTIRSFKKMRRCTDFEVFHLRSCAEKKTSNT